MQGETQPEGNGQEQETPQTLPSVTVGVMPNGTIGLHATTADREMILRLLTNGLSAVLGKSKPQVPATPKILLPGIEINGKRF